MKVGKNPNASVHPVTVPAQDLAPAMDDEMEAAVRQP